MTALATATRTAAVFVTLAVGAAHANHAQPAIEAPALVADESQQAQLPPGFEETTAQPDFTCSALGEGSVRAMCYGSGGCAGVTLTSEEGRLEMAQAKAKSQFRELTAAEKAAVGRGFRLWVYTRPEIECAGVLPTEVVVADSERNVRARFKLQVSKSAIKTNALGASGRFYEAYATPEPTLAQLQTAFGSPGVIHVITSRNTGSITFGTDPLRVWDEEGWQRQYADKKPAPTPAPDLVKTISDALQRACAARDQSPITFGMLVGETAKTLRTAIAQGLNVAPAIVPFTQCLEGAPEKYRGHAQDFLDAAKQAKR